jgi:hypothetical protein
LKFLPNVNESARFKKQNADILTQRPAVSRIPENGFIREVLNEQDFGRSQ